MKFKRSYSNARNLGSAYKFAFGGDINCVTGPRSACHSAESLLLMNIIARGPHNSLGSPGKNCAIANWMLNSKHNLLSFKQYGAL